MTPPTRNTPAITRAARARTARLPFMKISATGNDFVLMLRASLPDYAIRWDRIAVQVCDVQQGVGADGLIVLDNSGGTAVMDFYNPDGSRPAVCGNGLRACAWFLHSELGGPARQRIRAADGAHDIASRMTHASAVLRFETRRPRAVQAECSAGALDGYLTMVGVPHFVARVDRLDEDRWRELGCALRSADVFGAEGANINLWSPAPAGRVRMRTFERGVVPGETRACGSGAVAVARVLTDRYEYQWPVTLRPLGGLLKVSEPAQPGRAWLEGTVTELFRGTIPVTLRTVAQ